MGGLTLNEEMVRQRLQERMARQAQRDRGEVKPGGDNKMCPQAPNAHMLIGIRGQWRTQAKSNRSGNQ